MRRVFVSYSRNDLEAISQLIEDLQAVGVDAWHDQTLTGGQRWWDNILANIRGCDIFVFALSPASWDSEACRSELGYVVQLGKPILPALVSDGINLNLLPAPFSEIQVTDYRRRDKGATFALVKSINMTQFSDALPDPLPAPPPVPVSYLCTLKERIESAEKLNAQEQSLLALELEEAIGEGRPQAEIRDLLLRMKRRDDLLAKIGTKLDTALKRLGDLSTSVHCPATMPGTARKNSQSEGETRSCIQCRAPLPPESIFCPKCGSAVGEPAKPEASIVVPVAANAVQRPAGAKNRRYLCEEDHAPRLIADVKEWLDSQGFDSQQMTTDSHSVLLQIKKRGGWRDFVGMATSLNIVFHLSHDTMTVEVGAGKWIDKAAIGTVSLFILWPLALTAGYGAWEQMRMPDKIFDYVGRRLLHA